MARNVEAKARRKSAEEAPQDPAADASADRANGAHGTSGQLIVDLDFLRGLIEAVDASGIDSVEIVRAGTRVRISKSPPALPAAVLPSMTTPVMQPPVAATAVQGGGPAGQLAVNEAAVAGPPATKLVDVKSPMVGTFYRSPAPEAPAYVEAGSHVSKGQTLCILEAMKLMNELECEVDGIVREVLADNGEPVEFGQVLFRVEPSGS
jgi:acetyl-CoA carboxylase biotin carboxyl carrier protein